MVVFEHVVRGSFIFIEPEIFDVVVFLNLVGVVRDYEVFILQRLDDGSHRGRAAGRGLHGGSKAGAAAAAAVVLLLATQGHQHLQSNLERLAVHRADRDDEGG